MSVHTILIWLMALGSASGARIGSAAPVRLNDDDSGVRVAVSMRLSRADSGRQSMFGVLTLTMPLERLAPGPAPARAPRLAAAPAEPYVPTAGGGGSEALPPLPQSTHDDLAVALDPDLGRATVRAALRAAGFESGERRLSSLAHRARTSGALPELRLRGGRSTDESLRLSPTATDPYRYSHAGGTELFFEVRATWKLDRLLFSEAELRVEALRRQRAQAKARLVERVLSLLFAWQRARTRLATATLLPEERAMVLVAQIEAEAMLDVYTAGWFSERVAP